MKGSRKYLILFSVLFIVYVIAELNKPKPIDWTVTLSKSDKNPYGAYVLYQQLKAIYPQASLQSSLSSLYEQLHNQYQSKSAYILIAPFFKPAKGDFEKLRSYVQAGNDAFIVAANFSKEILDTFHLQTATRISLFEKDTATINFVNPALASSLPYSFLPNTIDEYFKKVDTGRTVVLGITEHRQPNFIKVPYGDGAFYFHAAPLAFSNYFLLYRNNAAYTAKCLSYISPAATTIYWDEYYKPGNNYAETPLRFFLSNVYLLWALRLAVAGLLIYILFEMKRRQRIIPVIEPLQNSSLSFVQTVSSVYFNQKDNEGIAQKKITYFLEFIRQRFFLQTQFLNQEFIDQLARKSGIDPKKINELMGIINEVNSSDRVSDNTLIELDVKMDNFYKQV